MNAAARLAVFGLGLIVAFGAALGAGRALGPADLGEPAAHDEGGHGGHAAELPPGLSAHDGRYALHVETVQPGAVIEFSVFDDQQDGALTEYDERHEKLMHLVLVRRDTTGYRHLHPTMDDRGAWTVSASLEPGPYKLFADFTPAGGENVVLGADLLVPGDFEPRDPPDGGSVDLVGDYRVRLDGDLVPGEESTLTVTVTKDDVPVDDLDPYLGAYGHLVTLRGDDLAYLHVHPEEGPPGPAVRFSVTAPTDGTYHLYFDFEHDGVVRTARFTRTTDEVNSYGAS